MSFFSNNKFKVKTTIKLDKVMFCINYFRVKDSDNFKSRLLQKLISHGHCLVSINTSLLCLNERKDIEGMVNTLIDSLDKLSINYRKEVVYTDNDLKLFGFSVNVSEVNTHKDYIIFFTINFDKLEAIQSIVTRYTLHYYISNNDKREDELINKFDSNYLNEEKLKTYFDYDVLDNNSIKQLVIYTNKKDSSFVSDIITKINQ